MLDSLTALLNDLADILIVTGSGLAQNASTVGVNQAYASDTGVTVFWNLAMGPFVDKIGELLSDIGGILSSFAGSL